MFRTYWKNLIGVLVLLVLGYADVLWLLYVLGRDSRPGWIETIAFVVSSGALIIVLMLVICEPLNDLLELRRGLAIFREKLDQWLESFNEVIGQLRQDRNQSSLAAQKGLEALVEKLQKCPRPGLFWYSKNYLTIADALFEVTKHLKKANRTDRVLQAEQIVLGTFHDFLVSMPRSLRTCYWFDQNM